jgi:Ca2+:H+ antiporter
MLFVYLLALVPVSLVLAYAVNAPSVWVFASALLAIAPLAEWTRRATDQLARSVGPDVGGLLNVTFGNIPEVILGLCILIAGHANVVKAQITGSIIGNGLLGLGMAILVGCWGRPNLTFSRERAGLLASLLMLAVIGLLVPAFFAYAERYSAGGYSAIAAENLSLGVSCVLIVIYIANLIYTLRTHRDVFIRPETVEAESGRWPVWVAVAVLCGATIGIAWEAELVAGAVEATAGGLGVSPFFLGVIVLAVIGNAAEYFGAVSFARRGRMELALGISVGGSVQVALLVAPLLVLISYFLDRPMDLIFGNPLELIAVAAVAFVVNAIASDGEATWFEGLLLLGVYAILALAFFYVTP